MVAGETVTGLPESEPGFQVYVDAPFPVSVVELPEQIVVFEAVVVTVGVGLTVINRVAVEEHPADVPVTV